MTLINCEKLAFSYDQKPVIKDLSFSISKGDYLCIVGENGVGKSTLIKCILGLIKPSGSITFGEGLSQSKIGYLPQQSEIQKDFSASVYEVVISGTLNKSKLIPFYTKRQKELAKKNLNLLGLDNIKKKCYQDLSGGQQQRVLLARALCAADSLILLDEPSSGLDPIVTNDLYDIINELNKNHNMSIIMISHDIKRAIKNASHILHLDHNDYFYGTVNEYICSEYFRKFDNNNERI